MRMITEDVHRRRAHLRALEINGERVSHLMVFDYDMRIGPAVVKMGGIGGVATRHEHRMKGYSRKVMLDTVRWMRDNGYDATVLYGIEHFYHKFGYCPCMPEVTATVRTRDAEEFLRRPVGFRVRAFDAKKDLGALLRLYNRANASRPLSIVRHKGRFQAFRHGSHFRATGEAFVLESSGGRFAGYCIYDASPAPTTACEVETASPEGLAAVLDELVRIAIERRDGEIAVRLPSDHPFVMMLRRLGCKVEIIYRTTGGPMGRIVNQDAFLGKIARAYAAKKGFEPRQLAFPVDVKTELGVTRVKVPGPRRAKRSSVALPAMTLFQMLTGFLTTEEVLTNRDVKVSGGGEALFEFLKPAQEPHMYSVDHF